MHDGTKQNGKYFVNNERQISYHLTKMLQFRKERDWSLE